MGHDPEIGGAIVEQLLADGYRTAFAHTAQHARALAEISPPALIVLGDFDSPRGALDMLAEVRRGDAPWHERLPVIVLGPPAASRARPSDLLRAFAAGADDFLACLVASEQGGAELDYFELRARMQALLRRASESVLAPLPRLSVGPLSIDTSSRTVLMHGHLLCLRPREYALLLHLVQEPTRVFTKPELLRALWGFHTPSSTRTLDSHACRLRAKLIVHSSQRWVLNVRGVGYRLTS